MAALEIRPLANQVNIYNVRTSWQGEPKERKIAAELEHLNTLVEKSVNLLPTQRARIAMMIHAAIEQANQIKLTIANLQGQQARVSEIYAQTESKVDTQIKNSNSKMNKLNYSNNNSKRKNRKLKKTSLPTQKSSLNQPKKWNQPFAKKIVCPFSLVKTKAPLERKVENQISIRFWLYLVMHPRQKFAKLTRKQALKYHPDKNPSLDAREKFEGAQAAYETSDYLNLVSRGNCKIKNSDEFSLQVSKFFI